MIGNRTLNEHGRVSLLARELQTVGVSVAAIQEVRWPRTGEREFRTVNPITNTSVKYSVYYSGGEKAERGVGFIVIGKQMKRVIRWKPVSERICVLVINIYAPTNDKPDDVKDAFYECLDKTYGECPKHDVKIVIGDTNAQVGREDFFRPIIGKESLHSVTNNNGLRLVTFAAARGMAISSTYFARKDIREHTWMHPNGETCNQIDHVLVDSRHFSDVIDRFSAEGVTDEYRQKLDERIRGINVDDNLNNLWE
ncbi:craniofacial development protein 2-like [Topomyia yanbarensis]|uniref:craniofacial development protein 2-like n=1 Tax=Topomyia yanbarensis TaxID=2498891 RepID=UPI00273CA637|nr:craniofacial development protein 2-like [Topomyia yanbarensis]